MAGVAQDEAQGRQGACRLCFSYALCCVLCLFFTTTHLTLPLPTLRPSVGLLGTIYSFMSREFLILTCLEGWLTAGHNCWLTGVAQSRAGGAQGHFFCLTSYIFLVIMLFIIGHRDRVPNNIKENKNAKTKLG